MKAIILCAGYATRLYPLTFDKPKSLLPIKGKPLLDYIIDKIPLSIQDVIVVTNDKFYNNFLEWSKKYGERIKVLNDGTLSNEDRLGGVGDLWFAIEKEKVNDDVLVLLGDNLFDFKLGGLFEKFKKIDKAILGACKFDDESIKKMGVIESDENEKIISLEEKPEKPKSNLAVVGVYIFPKKDLKKIGDYMKTDKPKDGPSFLIQDFCLNDDVYCFKFKGKWFDIGNKELYEKANQEW